VEEFDNFGLPPNIVVIGLRMVKWDGPRDPRRGSAAARLLRLRVRIQARIWLSVSCECCVLSGKGLCDELIPRPEESYRLWCVVVCVLETSRMRRPWTALGCCARGGGGGGGNGTGYVADVGK
jgi:hypothetical protein